MRRLRKSATNRMVVGVCGGLSEYFRVDPVIVRLIFIVLALANGIGVFIYLLLALIMPRAEATGEPLAVLKENIRTAPREAGEAGRRLVTVLRGPAGGEGDGQTSGASSEQPPSEAPRRED